MPRTPIHTGTLLAAAAAIVFGVATPFIKLFGAGAGPLATAALLYMGAALGSLSRGNDIVEGREARVAAKHLPRLFAVAFFGAALAPSLFAWGLQQVSATYGSLLLNGEAVFTVLLAAAIHREHISLRVFIAVGLMFAGGLVSVAGASAAGSFGLLGAAALVGAVLSWALDNVLTRPFADLDPTGVVRIKAMFGAAMTTALALASGDPWPSSMRIVGLLVCGATGYGLSLRLYLLAQRRIGAGRTGSVFAVAPFVGASAALLLGDRPELPATAAAAILFALGLGLHLSERHGHQHTHEPQAHDHAHTHDDGHHDHFHEVPAAGPHAHPHEHSAMVHAHPHAPDSHHTHTH